MRSVLLATAIFALAATAAFADDDLMASRYGNTVIAKSPNGPEAHLYYNADHTFTGKVIGMDFKLKGTWKIDGTNFCATYDPPLPGMANPACAPLEAHQIGDTWTSGDRTVTLVQGIQ
jgi:hypothetical protein